MKKKTMSLLLAAATALGMLAGCGGGNGNGEPSGGSQSAGADAGQESGEIKTINMYTMGIGKAFYRIRRGQRRAGLQHGRLIEKAVVRDLSAAVSGGNRRGGRSRHERVP